ncbi:MAG: hypothetical protein RIF46_07290 [Cyclobacteriaceae bacterium]
MEKGRFLIYLVTLALVFLGLTAIKMILPHEEPKEPVDEIGMRLYRPIFFASANESTTKKAENIQQDEFQDNVAVEDEPAETVTKPEKPAPKAKPKVSTPKPSNPSLDGADFFEEMVKEYKATTLKERKYRNDVVVRYYRHEPDGDRAQVLVYFGFYLHERPVSNQEEFNNVMSNVIYYGKDFPESDLKLITYLLIKNGIEIKELRRFKDFDGWKRKAIEIGASSYLKDKPVLTFDEIRELSSPN